MPVTRKKSVRRGKIQFESPHYRIYELQPSVLYIAKGFPIPDSLKRTTRVSVDPDEYRPYIYKHAFVSEDNDCLQFAEGLAVGIVGYSAATCVFSVKGSGRKFGVTDLKNIQLARKWRTDEKADPTEGQAFAIVHTRLQSALKTNEEVPPYHIAYVIAEDGEWRITLEADAGNPDLDRPIFGLYSVKQAKKSFHELHKDLFGGEKTAATLVLEKNDSKASKHSEEHSSAKDE